jgi:hypothetical protein
MLFLMVSESAPTTFADSLTNLPSLATSLKLARSGEASLLITGNYTVVPASGETAATLNVTVKIVRVNEGRFLPEDLRADVSSCATLI